MNSTNINDINASLKHGPYLSGKWNVIFYGSLILGILGVLCIIALVVIEILYEFDEDIVIIILLDSLIIVFCSALFIYFIVHNKKLKTNIMLWLKDAEMIKAETTTADRFRAFGQPVAEIALQVRFSYNGKSYVKYSEKNGKLKRYKLFEQYADRKILILYSPTYDQVMFLKPKSEQRLLAELAK